MAAKPQKRKKQFVRLYSLGEDKMRRINSELALPHASPAAVARMIQDEWKDHLDVTTASLAQQLERYRIAMFAGKLTIPVNVGLLRAKMLDPAVPPSLKMADESVLLDPKRSNPLNFLNELNHLAVLQMERVELALAREKELKMPISQTDSIIKNLRETLIEAQKMKFELGIDAYMMPRANGLAVSATVTPAQEGTIISIQVSEAVNEATEVINKLAQRGLLPRLVEGLPLYD